MSGSAGTGKTIVALHRAAYLARSSALEDLLATHKGKKLIVYTHLKQNRNRHDRGLAGTRSELERQARQLGVGVSVRIGEMIEEPLGAGKLRRNFRQPDGGLDRFNLAEERPDAAETVMPPVLEQAGCLGRDLPLAGIGQFPPVCDLVADLVDDRRRVVLLLGIRKALAFVEDDVRLFGRGLALLGLRDGRDEVRPPAGIDNFLGGLAVSVEFPVTIWVLIGRVKDWPLEKRISRGRRAIRHRFPRCLDTLPVAHSRV